jgi:hypothetical protein
MNRSVILAFASALLILVPSEGFARGGGGGHGGGFGGGFGGGHGGPSMGHGGRIFTGGPAGPVGFRAMSGSWHGARFDRHVGPHRVHHRRFFIGGYGGDYYYCYPVWNGYVWVSSCDYGY